MAGSAPINLFERVPGDVFRPLTGDNRARMWRLLVELYDQFFGPDASLAPEDGFTHRAITQAITHHLLVNPDWLEEGEDPLTPANVRANNALDRMITAGWLREERIGVRSFVVMHPTYGKFLEHLKQYAEEGPADVGGSVQLIHNTLLAAEQDPEGQAPAVRRAAREARDLIATLNNTHVRVREVMATISQEATTASYVRSFFEGYVAGILISDYRDLRTTNHPLRHRHDVLRCVADLRDEPAKRAKLLAGYRKLIKGDEGAVETAMARDFERFRRFEDIEVYLSRLDGGIARGARQALAFISYSLRTRDRLERLITQTASAVAAIPGPTVDTPWGAGGLFAAHLLREPRLPKPPAPRTPIRRRKPTPEELALWALQRAMVHNREVSPRQAIAYLDRHLVGRDRLASEDLSIESVNDFVIFAALGRVAQMRAIAGGGAGQSPLSRALQGYRITLDAGQMTENDYLVASRFEVALEKNR